MNRKICTFGGCFKTMISNQKRKLGWLLACTLLVCTVFAQTYSVTGGGQVPLLAENNTADRIQVYLTYGMEGVQISYTSTSSSHRWFRYRTSALNDSEPVASTQNGTTSIVANPEEGFGYYVRENENIGMNYFVWIVDYRQYEFFIRNMRISPDVDECMAIGLEGDADVPDMMYYAPSGSQLKLNREFELSYATLRWDESRQRFEPFPFTKTFNTHPFATTFPSHSDDPMLLADTEITLRGDLFARHFGVEKSISIPYQAKAVQVYADTLILSAGTSNMGESDGELYAPVLIRFNAYANIPVTSRFVWKIYNVEEPQKMLIQHNSDELEYTFSRAGTFIARLEVSDRTGACSNDDNEDHEFRIEITETEMVIPNAFSPGTTPGFNDIFKVRFKSVVRFQGWIFNRWGTELFHWSDPTQGWDGKYRGQYVPAGAYYYLIEYTGTDGKKRTKKGDINVFRGRNIDTEVKEVN